VALGTGGDRLAVRDARRARVELYLVLRRHLFQQCLQVNLAQAAQHGLVRLRDVLDPKAGILGGELVQRIRQALLVAAFLRRDRKPEHRRRQLERLDVQVRVLGRVVQDVIELDLVDLRDRADVARNGLGHLDLRLAPQHVEMPGADRLAALADVELAPRGKASLVHAEHGDASDVRIDLHLDDVRERVLRRIGGRGQLGGRAVRSAFT
jgi:hypothetical protein